jgi:hypothetical protein
VIVRDPVTMAETGSLELGLEGSQSRSLRPHHAQLLGPYITRGQAQRWPGKRPTPVAEEKLRLAATAPLYGAGGRPVPPRAKEPSS